AYNTTNEFTDEDYWSESTSLAEIENFWFFGKNGQGDLWLLDLNNIVYFYDHNQEKFSLANFLNLNINFEQWLQLAFLEKQLDDITEINIETKLEFKNLLGTINKNLAKNYPFDL